MTNIPGLVWPHESEFLKYLVKIAPVGHMVTTGVFGGRSIAVKDDYRLCMDESAVRADVHNYITQVRCRNERIEQR